MNAPLIVASLMFAQAPAVVTYEQVPAEAATVIVYEWPGDAPPSRAAVWSRRAGDEVLLWGTAAGPVIVVAARPDGGYLLDGPFNWPPADLRRRFEGRWYRSDQGAIPPEVHDSAVIEWIRADGLQGRWPRCVRAARAWECWGIQPVNRGVIAIVSPGRVWSAVTSPLATGPLRASAWGRLVLISDSSHEVRETRIAFGHPVPPPPDRLTGIRLDSAAVPGARAAIIAPDAAWITGASVPPKAWVEVRTAAGGPAFLALQDVAEGGPSAPLALSLVDRRSVGGTVTSADGRPAARALITMFRLIDPPSPPGSRVRPRRVFAAETSADADGAFRIEEVGDAEYELVAFHSQLGRAAVAVEPSRSQLDIRLVSSGTARGRVLAAGKPLSGVEVTSVPDAASFNAVEDLTSVKGGDARTGEDGRFSVMVAASGGGELRVGGGDRAVRRIPLPRPPVQTLDLGDIDLGLPIEVFVILDRDLGCAVRAVGPIGRTGLQVVSATKTGESAYRLALPEEGTWQFGLACAVEKHALSPGALRIGPAQAGKELRFAVR